MANVNQRIREDLERGEWVSVQDTIDKYKANPSALNQVTLQYKKKGIKLEKKREGRNVFYRLAPAKPAPAAAPNNSTPIEPQVLPQLGEMVEICALAIDRKGVIGITLRNSKHAWRVQVTDVVK